MSVPLGGSAEIGIYGAAKLAVRSNNPGTVPSSFVERTSGDIRILKLQGTAVGTAMIEVGPTGQKPWIVLQVQVGMGATSGPDPVALAEQAKPGVNAWILAATSAITAYKRMIMSGMPALAAVQQPTIDALNTHFHLNSSTPGLLSQLDFIQRIFQSVQNTLTNSKPIFKRVDRATAAVHFQKTQVAAWVPPPAYVLRGTQSVYFSPEFNTKYGPFCRMAMVLHECAHFADVGVADHAYEHQPAYATLTPALATHNASSYPTFAAHVSRGFDKPRYGAGNPSL